MTTTPFGSMSIYTSPDDDEMWVGVPVLCMISNRERTCLYVRESEWNEVRAAMKEVGVLNEQPRSLH